MAARLDDLPAESDPQRYPEIVEARLDFSEVVREFRPGQPEVRARKLGEIRHAIARYFSEIERMAHAFADVDQVADFTAESVRFVMRTDCVNDVRGQLPCAGQNATGVAVVVTKYCALGDKQRDVFIEVPVECLQEMCWTGGVHQQLADVVQQSAGERQFGIDSGLLGKHACAGGDAQ